MCVCVCINVKCVPSVEESEAEGHFSFLPRVEMDSSLYILLCLHVHVIMYLHCVVVEKNNIVRYITEPFPSPPSVNN